MKHPSPLMSNVASIVQDMSSSPPFFTQPPSSSPTPFSATSNVIPQMVYTTMSNSIPVITQSISISSQPSLSSHSQQLIAIPTTTTAATNLPVLTGISETPENYVFEHFKFSCEISASPDSDGDKEWDFLDDFKPLIPLPTELALETSEEDEEISDADDVEDSEVLDDLKHLIPLPAEILLARETGKYEEISDDEEWDVLDDFKLLIPLPPLETGKYEEVLFEDQTNLYKFVDQEWKEPNLCIVKILHNCFNGRVRLLMRREEVLKACANHYITPDMEIHPLKNLDQAWTWVAQEFVNEELKPVHFCIRFKDAELATAFKAAFIKAVTIANGSITNHLSSSKVAATDSHVISEPFELKFASTWCCPFCKTNNGADKHFCFICKTTKPCCCRYCEVKDSGTNNLYSSKSCGLKFASTASSWCCPLCETNNGADKYYCVICETSKPILM